METRVLLAATNPLDLATLDGTTGFRLDGIDADDWSGHSASSAGDVNGDGFDDLIIGAFKADPNGSDSGESYVVFGMSGGFSTAVDLSTLDGTTGFRLDGIVAGDHSGASVSSAGDVNGDGFDDLIIGASSANPNDSGASYVVFGKSGGFSAAVNLSTLDGTTGFRLNGIDARDHSGASVSSAGDVNGDGFDDLIIGAGSADPNGSDSGESYVVFGKSGGFGSAVNLSMLDGTIGFRLDGIEGRDWSGASVSSAGDVNGDGFDDLVIGARFANPGGNLQAGESYVVFGKSGGFSSAVNLSTLDGTTGFRLDGIDVSDTSGVSVSSAGDVNGDGFDDVIIGAFKADPGGDSWAGESYVVFGKSGGFSLAVDLAALDGTTGFQLDGIDADDISGFLVSGAGDVNGDGFDDLIIGALFADADGKNKAGESYVVFGGNFTGGSATQVGTDVADILTANRGESAIDLLIGGLGNDTLISDGGADVLRGGAGNDTLSIPDTDFSGTRRLVGGNGNDTVRLAGGAITFDLTAIHDNRIMDVEAIDVRGDGDNTLTLDFQEVINISSSSNTLAVRHDSGDTINIGDGWMQASRRTIESVAYDVFTQGVAELLIEDIALKVSQSVTLPGAGGEYVVTIGMSGSVVEVRQTLPSAATILTVPLNQLGDLIISGSANADTVTLGKLDGYGQTIIFNGNGGDDLFDASAASQTTRVQGGAGNDTFVGGSGDDRFDGGSGADRGTGGAGNDSLIGNSGNDTLRGDSGDDFLNGNAGRDVLTGNAGNDTVFGGSGRDTLDGGSGADFVNGQGGRVDIVAGGGGADTLRGGASDVILPGSADTVPATPTAPGSGSTLNVTLPETGGPFTILVDGSSLKVVSTSETVVDVYLLGISDVSIVGTDGDDSVILDASLESPIGSVTFSGGAGNDSFDSSAVNMLTLFVGGAGNDTLTGGVGRDIFLGGDGDDSASGGAGNDVLNGNSGKDSLFGGSGDDRLLGCRDADLLDGGNGSDVVNGQSGTGDIVAGGGGGADSLLGDSSDTLIDGPSGIGPGSAGPGGTVSNGVLTVVLPVAGGSFNVLVSAGQIQVVSAGGGTPLVDELFAGITDVVINGGAGDDSVLLDATLTAIVGTVSFNSFGGDDSLDSSSYAANIAFNGGDGDDTLIGGIGNDVVNSGAGNDSIVTGAGTDLVDAGSGDDFVDAGTDADTIFGEAGDDVLIGGAGTDLIDARSGDDFVDAGSDDDTVFGGAGRDVLIGGSGNDFLNGNGGSDTITGEDGNDTLLGGSHRDSLDGGLGDDLVRGQGGGGDKAVGGDGVDVVVP